MKNQASKQMTSKRIQVILIFMRMKSWAFLILVFLPWHLSAEENLSKNPTGNPCLQTSKPDDVCRVNLKKSSDIHKSKNKKIKTKVAKPKNS